MITQARPGECNADCKIIIVTVIGSIAFLSIVSGMIWKIRKGRKLSSKPLKHVESAISLSVIPSDYVADHEVALSAVSSSSLDWSPRFAGCKLPVRDCMPFIIDKISIIMTKSYYNF